MPTEVVMPKWGLSMQEGKINLWLKREGEAVQQGEPIAEVETEKITNVVEAPVSGVLARLCYPEGSIVAVTKVIAYITAPGEHLPDVIPNGSAEPAVLAEVPPLLVSVVASVPSTPPVRLAGPVRAMPAARKLAQEHGIDLSTVTGSGPGGAIIKEDVEQAIAARTAPQPLQRVQFYSAGYRLDGLLYTPRSLPPGERRPGVVLLVGYTYLKTMVMPDIAKVLNAAGYVVLVFDYRGFGESEGPRGLLLPLEQVADARAALTFLGEQPTVDPERLALVGISLGGAHAITTAAVDERVKAAVALEPPGNGARWLRSLRRHWEWREFLARLAEDRRRRVMTGVSTPVDPLEIVVPDPESQAFLNQVSAEFPQMRVMVPLESAEALIEYAPEEMVHRLAPRPLLIVHGDADQLVPLAEAESIAIRAGPSCRLDIVPGMSHFNWVVPGSAGFIRVTDRIVSFLQEVLPVHVG
ncbi:alpha/beta fold hydrolase [Chloroflexus aggregans]|uniref:E3 binding domain protein n=1 Tax=Chloroflexus aggregans (strain MD-66 / DSM 9485) TaxID=326427 RepID=B8G4B5_CHLAD|nr:alpha/beta fold hydrolase [Chloroflexus aggregans]ACL23521.1 E3 binding domain protein [Chloroflexus aggregans DSM 9485]